MPVFKISWDEVVRREAYVTANVIGDITDQMIDGIMQNRDARVVEKDSLPLVEGALSVTGPTGPTGPAPRVPNWLDNVEVDEVV